MLTKTREVATVTHTFVSPQSGFAMASCLFECGKFCVIRIEVLGETKIGHVKVGEKYFIDAGVEVLG